MRRVQGILTIAILLVLAVTSCSQAPAAPAKPAAEPPSAKAAPAADAAKPAPAPAAKESKEAPKPAAPAAAKAEPVKGGTLTYVIGTEVESLDANNVVQVMSEIAAKMLYNGLVSYNEKMEIQPDLAEKWTLSPDGTTYTFSLRKAVKFHDGTPFNAQSAKIFFDRMVGGKEAKSGMFTNLVKSSEVVDDSTIKVTLNYAFSTFLNRLAHAGSGIVSPAALEKYGKDVGRNPVGTGPFKFVEWVKGDRVVLERNDAYFKGAPNLDRVIYKFVPEEGTRLMMLEAGDAQLVTGFAPEERSRLEKNTKLKVSEFLTARALYLVMNNTWGPFQDKRVRQAMNYAVNRPSIAKDLYGGSAVPIPGPLSPRVAYYAEVKGYDFNIQKAKDLLTQAGYPNGFEVSLWMAKGRFLKDYELVQELQRQLAVVGVKVKIETMEWAALQSGTDKAPQENKSQMFLYGIGPSTGEASWSLEPTLRSANWKPKGANRAFYKNEKFDEAIDKAMRAPTEKEAVEQFTKSQEIVIEDAPFVYLVAVNQTVAMSSKLRDLITLPIEYVLPTEKTWLEK